MQPEWGPVTKMLRTIQRICLAAAMALAIPGASLAGQAGADRKDMPSVEAQARRVQQLKKTLRRLAVDPASLIAGAIECTCLRDLLFPHSEKTRQHSETPQLQLGPRTRRDSASVSISPTLIEDQPGLQLHIQW